MDSVQPPITGDRYVVVARRYRPKGFDELIGQETVAQALTTAIRTGRVGHAYLFTGARGVGKTSTARIFAKALNAPGGPTPTPSLESDIALAIDAGEDIDVIEIDGASNRGIDEIRQLRANVNVRPSRSRYKIYIIDEVHMLTTQAFNALLKTLEEPPEHVKFIFCTTDPDKIPITVLSRCQRFDFAPVHTKEIFHRLKFICEHEGREFDDAALQVIARRAAGSMRDSQSLLEQLLSFCSGKLTLQAVHDVLGTAEEELLCQIATLLYERNQAGILQKLESASAHGVDLGLLAEQLLSYLRDILVTSVGGTADLLRTANPENVAALERLGVGWGVPTLMAAIQILDEALVKMRYSVQGRILFELALLQICQLQDLSRISQILTMLERGETANPPAVPPTVAANAAQEKKNVDALTEALESEGPEAEIGAAEMIAESSTISSAPTISSTTLSKLAVPAPDNAIREGVEPTSEATHARQESASPMESWTRAVAGLEGLLRDFALMVERVEEVGYQQWEVVLPNGSELALQELAAASSRSHLAKVLQNELGYELNWTIRISDVPRTRTEDTVHSPAVTQAQRRREIAAVPLVRKILDTFGGDFIRIDGPPASSGSGSAATQHSIRKEVASNV